MLYQFQLDDKAVETAKLFVVQKVKVYLITIPGGFKKFCLGFKDLNDQQVVRF